MAPDWNKLGASFADSSSVLIVDVDCTADGERTCQRMGVRGYPTIKYFMSGDKKGKDYQQGRDFNALKQFAERTLNKPTCDAVSKKGCAKNEVAFIEKHEGKSAEDIKAVAAEKSDELKAVKAERAEAEREMKAKTKEWKKKEAALNKAQNILKQMEKNAA